MEKKLINRAIDELGPWHQRFKMGRVYTTKKMVSGEHVWPEIRDCMLEDLRWTRVLDLGSNAGYYSAMAALEGAEVVSVEPSKLYIKQAKWTKYYFEEKNGALSIKLIEKSVSKLNYKDMGYFDCVLALSIFDCIEDLDERKRVIAEICQITSRVVVRTPNDHKSNSVGFFNGAFMENGFYMLKKILAESPLLVYGPLEGQYY